MSEVLAPLQQDIKRHMGAIAQTEQGPNGHYGWKVAVSAEVGKAVLFVAMPGRHRPTLWGLDVHTTAEPVATSERYIINHEGEVVATDRTYHAPDQIVDFQALVDGGMVMVGQGNRDDHQAVAAYLRSGMSQRVHGIREASDETGTTVDAP